MKRGLQKISAIILVVLVMTMPFVIAAGSTVSSFTEGTPLGLSKRTANLGEFIIINIANIEPVSVRQAMLEQQNVPVFVYLKGTTIGTTLSPLSNDPSQKDPLYGITNIPPIKSIVITPINLSRDYIASYRYVSPDRNAYSLSNMGYIILNLKRQKNITILPEKESLGLKQRNLDIQVQAQILFDFQKGSLLGIGEQERVLQPMPDDAEFQKIDISPYAILGGRAYVRATDISSDSVTLVVYDKSRNPISIISPYMGANQQGVQPLSNLRLTPGGVSNVLSLGQSNNPFTDNFRVRLDKIITPQSTATLNVVTSGQSYKRVLRVGDRISEGSSWVVKEIYDKPEVTPKPTEQDLISFKVDKEKLSTPLSSLGLDVNKILLQNAQTSATKTLTTKRLVSNTGFISSSEKLKDEAVDLIIQRYCPPTNDEPACSAVANLQKVIKQYSSSPDALEAYQNLAEIFNNELILTNNYPCSQIKSEPCAAYKRDMKNLAVYYYDKVVQLNPALAAEVEQKKLEQGFTIEDSVYLDDDGVTVFLITSTPLNKKTDLGSTKIKIADFPEKDYYVGELLVDDKGEKIKGYTDDGRTYYFRVYGIDPNRVVIDRVYTNPTLTEKVTSAVKETAYSSIGFTSNGVLPNKEVFLDYYTSKPDKTQQPATLKVLVTKIQSKNNAYITILPGLTEAAVTSNFTIHVPIDPRLFSYTPDELRNKINSTRDLIEKFDSVIDNLDSVVRTWKRTCLITFAVLTVKNSFLAGPSRNLARKEVSAFYKQKCAKAVSQGKYDTNIECYSANSEEMTKAIDADKKAIDDVQSQLKGKSLEDLEKTDDFKHFEMAGGSLEQYREHLKYNALKTSVSQDSDFGKYIMQKSNDINYEGKIILYKEASEWAKSNKNKISADISEEVLIQNYIVNKANPQTSFSTSNANTIKLTEIRDMPSNKDAKDAKTKSYYAVVPDGKSQKPATLKTVNAFQKEVYEKGFPDVMLGQSNLCKKEYEEKMGSSKSYIMPQSDLSTCVKNNIGVLEKTTAKDKNNNDMYIEESKVQSIGLTYPASSISTTKDMLVESESLITNKNPLTFYSSSSSEFAGDKQVNRQYTVNMNKQIVAQYDNNGQAYCYPIGKGEYVQVLERYNTGTARLVRVMNVGLDGVIDCGRGDDVIVKSESLLEMPGNAALKNQYVTKANQAPKCTKEGATVGTVDGSRVVCSMNSALTNSKLETTECIDTMDPADCRILFNACDPVMCPASRCNLGGRYTPKGGVISSGLVGSAVLCTPNFPEVVVPFCLTGILSGLKGIRSILQGYADCLEVNLKDGSNVGFCDYITNVGICEILWREAMFIVDMKGGVLNWLSGKIFGKETGGGEYLTFQSALDNVGDSVEAFTKEYSDTRIAALYKGSSTQEFGTEVCRRAVYGKFPSIGDILDQLSEPEDPPQFYAFFDTAPYAQKPGSTLGASAASSYGAKELVTYTVFYHIYAGTGFSADQPLSFSTGQVIGQQPNAPIRYSVVLRNKQTNKVMYVTTNPEQYGDTEKTIARGSYAQQTIITVAEPGFTEICVIINGREECGFKKVSTDLAVKMTEDAIAGDEAKRRDIKSAAECVPEYSRTSPTLRSIPTPVDVGLLSTGISRVCSLQEPTAETGRWINVGVCGKDDKGMDQGTCWLDSRSINIEDKKLKEQTIQGLKAANLPSEKQALIISASDSEQILLLLNEQRNSLIEQIRQAYENAKKAATSTI